MMQEVYCITKDVQVNCFLIKQAGKPPVYVNFGKEYLWNSVYEEK